MNKIEKSLSFENFEYDDYEEIELDEISNDNMTYYNPYTICSDKIDNNNGLIIDRNNLLFYINECIPFKYHRNVLGLVACTQIYNDVLINEFSDIGKVEVSMEDEGSFLINEIEFKINNNDVEAFFKRYFKCLKKSEHIINNMACLITDELCNMNILLNNIELIEE